MIDGEIGAAEFQIQAKHSKNSWGFAHLKPKEENNFFCFMAQSGEGALS